MLSGSNFRMRDTEQTILILFSAWGFIRLFFFSFQCELLFGLQAPLCKECLRCITPVSTVKH